MHPILFAIVSLLFTKCPLVQDFVFLLNISDLKIINTMTLQQKKVFRNNVLLLQLNPTELVEGTENVNRFLTLFIWLHKCCNSQGVPSEK